MFKKLGARKILNSDQLAHETLRPGNQCYRRIKSFFHLEGPINRKQLAREIFANPEKRKKLEAIIHPYVRRRMMNEIKKVKQGIVILEVPLLFEAKFDRICNATIVVSAGKSNIMKRLMRAGFGRAEINSRLKAQFSESEKMKRADIIISNKGSKKLLEQKTKLVWKKLKLQFN